MAALSNVNPNSYVVCWSDPVAILRYFVILAYPFRFSGEYLYPLLRVFHVGVNIEGCNAFPFRLAGCPCLEVFSRNFLTSTC